MSGGNEKSGVAPLNWPYSQQKQPGAAVDQAGPGVWQRSDGTRVNMTDLNPHHRAAAIKKAERAGDKEAAAQLRASGPLPD